MKSSRKKNFHKIVRKIWQMIRKKSFIVQAPGAPAHLLAGFADGLKLLWRPLLDAHEGRKVVLHFLWGQLAALGLQKQYQHRYS